MEVGPTGDVFVPINRTVVALLMLVGLAVTAVLVWCAVWAPIVFPGRLWMLIVFWGEVGLCGSVTLLLIGRLFSRTAGLVIDHDGIVDRMSYLGAGKIGWQDIRRARLWSLLGLKYIIIHTHNPWEFINRGNILQRGVKAMSGVAIGRPVTLTMWLFDARAADVMATIGHFFDRAVGRRVSPSG